MYLNLKQNNEYSLFVNFKVTIFKLLFVVVVIIVNILILIEIIHL